MLKSTPEVLLPSWLQWHLKKESHVQPPLVWAMHAPCVLNMTTRNVRLTCELNHGQLINDVILWVCGWQDWVPNKVYYNDHNSFRGGYSAHAHSKCLWFVHVNFIATIDFNKVLFLWNSLFDIIWSASFIANIIVVTWVLLTSYVCWWGWLIKT